MTDDGSVVSPLRDLDSSAYAHRGGIRHGYSDPRLLKQARELNDRATSSLIADLDQGPKCDSRPGGKTGNQCARIVECFNDAVLYGLRTSPRNREMEAASTGDAQIMMNQVTKSTAMQARVCECRVA